MTLTIVIGSSGSGKTTFLNDVYKRHACIYLRQYHSLRPYIPVSHIPNFDPTQLPYWHIYETEGTADTICVGGTLAGEFTAGLSGGQRKLLLFELLCQRLLPPKSTTTITTSTTTTNDESQGQQQQQQPQPESPPPHQTGMRIPELICLDEPFCGVTDDYVSFVTKRLHQLQRYHFIVLVTNDHVEALTQMATHILTVSAVDRTVVELQLPPPPPQPVVSDDETDQDDEENPFQTPGAPPESSSSSTSHTKNPTTLSSSSSSSSKKRRQVVSRELMIQALSVVGKKDWRNGGRRGSTRSTRSSFHITDTNATSDDDATTMTTTPTTSLWSDAYFFYQVEVVSNRALWGVVLFTLVCLGLFVVAFWNSNDDQAALVLVGGDVIAFFVSIPVY